MLPFTYVTALSSLWLLLNPHLGPVVQISYWRSEVEAVRGSEGQRITSNDPPPLLAGNPKPSTLNPQPKTQFFALSTPLHETDPQPEALNSMPNEESHTLLARTLPKRTGSMVSRFLALIRNHSMIPVLRIIILSCKFP